MESARTQTDSLTPSQRLAVAARGNVLVMAGAGTGKTKTLVARCLDCLDRERASLDELLIVTFTEAAAAELRQRLRRAIEEKAAADTSNFWQEQLARFDIAHIGTLHSFCLRLVREHFHELGLDPQLAILDEGEGRQRAGETLDELFQAHYAGADEFSLAVQNLIQIHGGGRDEKIRALILRLHHYSQTRPDAAGWLAQQIQKFSATKTVEWQDWLLMAIEDWRDEWLPVLAALGTPVSDPARLANRLFRAGSGTGVPTFDMSETQNIPAIEMRGVSIAAMRDASFTVVEDVNWPVAAGEFWIVAGQEHSGKSDLLMLAAGLMMPAAGSFKLFGNDTKDFGETELAERLRVGFVFQGGQLFNQLTIAENAALPLQYQKNFTAAEAAPEAQALLELMELTPLADVTPANIAAYWRQRAALARALILQPEILLLDNPLAGLGARHLQWWLHFLDQLSRGHGQFGGKQITIIASADDLRHWQNTRRKFALLRDKRFIRLGGWSEVETSDDFVVKELLAVQLETAT